MPSKKQSPATVGTPTVSPQKGIELIQEQIEAGNHLIASGTLRDAPYHTWQTKTGAYLQKIFGPTSPQAEEFRDFGRFGAFPGSAGEVWWSPMNSKPVLAGSVQIRRYSSVTVCRGVCLTN